VSKPIPSVRLVVAVVLSAVLASCTASADAPTGPQSASTGQATQDGTSTPPTGATQPAITGAPAALTALVERVYSGADLAASATPDAAAALKGRKAAPGTPTGAATTGTWKGQQVAVVTVGDDVTLAVAAKGDAWRVVGGWWPSLDVARPSLGKGPRWVLALGSDARKGQRLDRSRADTIQVVGTDGAGGGGVMGMARDLWVPLSTGGKGKINSAMVLGGPQAQLQTVRAATGLPIEGYVVIDFTGFKKVIDEQGGIPIVIPKRIDLSHAKLVLEKGPQVLSGAQALAYARERKTLSDGDFGRSRHQGEILLAAAIKARLAGPGAIPGAMTSVDRHAKTDLDGAAMLTYLARFYRMDPSKVGRGVAQGSFGWAGSQSIVVLGRQAKDLFARFKDGNLS
jgi:LCP family protein required for cell wall assembly